MEGISPLPKAEKWILELAGKNFPATLWLLFQGSCVFYPALKYLLQCCRKTCSDDYFHIFKYMGILTFCTLPPFPTQLDLGG